MEMTLGGGYADTPTPAFGRHTDPKENSQRVSSAVPINVGEDALDKRKAPLSVALQTVGGNKGGKIRALKPEYQGNVRHYGRHAKANVSEVSECKCGSHDIPLIGGTVPHLGISGLKLSRIIS